MVLCVAFGCNSRSEKDNVSFFQFPKDEKLKKLWIEKLNRGKTTTQQFAPTVHHKLCSKHFEDNQFKISPSLASNIGYECNFRLRLKDEAVPTIFETSTTLMTAEKRPTTERQSAKKIREKKLKLEIPASNTVGGLAETTIVLQSMTNGQMKIKSSLKSLKYETESNKDRFLDSSSFEAEPMQVAEYNTDHNVTLTCSSTTTTTTVTTASSSASMCSTVESRTCPLTWFANLAGNVHRLDAAGKKEGTSKNLQLPVSESTTNKEMFSMQTQTPYNLISRRHVEIQASKKMVSKETQTPRRRMEIPSRRTDAEISLNDSLISIGSEDERDPDWTPDDCSDNENEISVNDTNDAFEESEINEAKEKKFIVFESCLDLLFENCNLCNKKNSIRKKVIGTGLAVTTMCYTCGNKSNWSSQPMSGAMPYGNLILSAAIMFCGASPVKCLRALDFAGIENISISTYNKIQSSYLTPGILQVWKRQQESSIQTIQQSDRQIRLAGDARCCTPGHTAKFASYSMLDLDTGKILDFKLVQVNEVRNSYAMELEGLRRSLNFLIEDKNLMITDLVTDRHSSVKKYMREDRADINHLFDVWHVAKGIYKKLENIGKKKGCAKVKEWARSISNHLYWCAASSNGDGELVKQKWTSILNHVANIHDGHGDRFPQCQHDELEDRNWMVQGRKPHAELEKVVKGKLLLNDVKKLSPSDQTSSLESFHNIVCSYAAKSVHYFHAQMEARIALAALHFNENTKRQQAVNREGQNQYSMSFPKARKMEAVVREVKVEQTFNYIDELMREVLQSRTLNKSYKIARTALRETEQERPLPVAQSTPARPRKEDVIRAHVSRFNR